MKEKTKTAKAVEKIKKEKSESKNLATASGVAVRGRIFKGVVTRKFPKRIAIEFDRTVKIPKFERFMKKKTRIHARLPDEMASQIHIGDLIRVQECRPLSKMIHFVVIEKLRSGDVKEEEK
jgi:small subunit ribosomal protein S17